VPLLAGGNTKQERLLSFPNKVLLEIHTYIFREVPVQTPSSKAYEKPRPFLTNTKPYLTSSTATETEERQHWVSLGYGG